VIFFADNLHTDPDLSDAIADNQLIFVGAINKETWRRIKKAKLVNEFRESIRTHTLDDFLTENHFQTSSSYDDIRIRHELSSDLVEQMRNCLDRYDPAGFDQANQAHNLGELFPLLDQTLNNSF
jgi:formate-dependent nitrite reductase cytochrome c552 subunit